MELKQKQVLITIWILGNPECQRSVADRFNITKSILFRVYRSVRRGAWSVERGAWSVERVAIANNLSGQYVNHLHV